MLLGKFVFLLWSATSVLAESESLESQQVTTKEPLKEVPDGEQDDLSQAEESQELTERPVQQKQTEDEILLDGSTVDYYPNNAKEEKLSIVENNDIEASDKEVDDSDFVDVENDEDYSYDNYPADTVLDEYYDDEFESFKEVPLYDVLGQEQVSLEQVVEIEPQDFDLTQGSLHSDERFSRQSDLTQLSEEELDGKDRKVRQFANQQFGFQQQQQPQQLQQQQQQQQPFTTQQQFAQQQQQLVARQQQLVQQQQQQLIAQQQQQFPAQQQSQQFFASPQQQQQSAQSKQFQNLGVQSNNQFTQRFTTPGFQTRFPQQGQPQNQFTQQALQPQTQFAQQPVQPQNDFLQPQTQFGQQPSQPQFAPQPVQQQFQSNQFQQPQQQFPQQQFSQPQQPAQQLQSFVSFGQNDPGQVSFTTQRPEAVRQNAQAQFQSFSATPQPTRQPVIQGTPQPGFQAFQSGQVNQQGFNIQELGFQGFDFGNNNLNTNTQQQQFIETEPQTRRPPNARPPPNADPRQNRFTTSRPQAAQQFQATPALKAPRINDPVSNFIQGNSVQQTLRQEPANQIKLEPFTTPRGPVQSGRGRQPVNPSLLGSQNTITTFRPNTKNNQIESTRAEPIPKIPGNSNGSPSFANFPAGKTSGAVTAVPEAKKQRTRNRGNRKRLRLRKKPEDVKGGDFIPTPPTTSSRQRARPNGNRNSFIPTPPTTGRRGSRLRTQNNLIPESPRSTGIQPNSNSVINLAEIAGVKELEAALRQRDKEIRSLKSKLQEAERSFENQLNQQSRKLTTGNGKVNELESTIRDQKRTLTERSGQVKELEITLRDQTRRLAESTKKIFDYEQSINDLEKNVKKNERLIRDRDSKVEFQAEQLKEMLALETQVQDYKRELAQLKNELNSRGRKVKELENLTIKQDQITVDNVKKIQLIESTIDEVEQIVFSKDQVIQNLKINIEDFRSNSEKDARKIDELEGDLDQRTREVIDKDRKLREFKQTLANQQAVIDDKDEDIAELNNRTRLHLEYATEKQKEILQLERAVATLRNTTLVKDEQILSLGEELKVQVNNLNGKIQETENLKSNVTQGIENIQRRDQKIGTLEGAVTSLKDIIQQNNIKIGNLNKAIEQNKVEVSEKDKFIHTQRERLTQASQSIKDLQILLGDAGNTIDEKNKEIEELDDKVETFKLDKKNLLGIVQQLATIGNPNFNFASFMDSVSEKTKKDKAESRAFKSAPLVAQESQRSVQILKSQAGPKRRANKKPLNRKQLHSIPRQQKVIDLNSEFSQPQRRSFVDNSFNSIQTPVVKENKEDLENEYDYADYGIKTKEAEPLEEEKDLSIFVEIEGKEANDKDHLSATTITSLLGDFPSFIAMAEKLTTSLPQILTNKPTTTTVPTTTSTTTTSTTTTTTTTTTTSTTTTTTTTTAQTTTATPTSTTTQDQTTLSSEPMSKFSLMVTPMTGEFVPMVENKPIFVGVDSVKISKNVSLERADHKPRSRVNKPSKRKLGRKVTTGAARKRFGQKLGFRY